MSIDNFKQKMLLGEKARLIPVTADQNKEARALSILLATLYSVPAFQKAMMGSIGQKIGANTKFEALTEVCFKEEPNKEQCKIRPDGLLILEKSKNNTWAALIEAKIKSSLDVPQLQQYIELAKKHKINALITISNQFVLTPTHSPVELSSNVCKGIEIYHWSWMHAITVASITLSEDKFDNQEQKYILTEMIRFFTHQSIGVSNFNSMNKGWKEIVATVKSGAPINKTDEIVKDTVSAWHQESKDLCLLLSQKINCIAKVRISRSHIDSPIEKIKEDSERLCSEHRLISSLDVTNAASALSFSADLLRRTVTTGMVLDTPKDKKKTSSMVKWLIKQIPKGELHNLYVKAHWPGRLKDTLVPLDKLIDNPEIIEHDNSNALPIKFEVLMIVDLANKFGNTKIFIEQLEKTVLSFYELVGQHLRAYIPPAPKVTSNKSVENLDLIENESSGDQSIIGENLKVGLDNNGLIIKDNNEDNLNHEKKPVNDIQKGSGSDHSTDLDANV